MKSNKEILDNFGKKVIETVFDFNYVMLKSNIDNNLKKRTCKKQSRLFIRRIFKKYII